MDFYQNCRLSSEYIYYIRGKTSIYIIYIQKIKKSLHLCLLLVLVLVMRGENPTVDNVFYKTLSTRLFLVDYARRRVRRSMPVISPSLSPSTTSTTSTASISSAIRSTLTYHQAGRFLTVSKALHGMYLIITTIYCKCRSN